MTMQTLDNRILKDLNFAWVEFTRVRWKGKTQHFTWTDRGTHYQCFGVRTIFQYCQWGLKQSRIKSDTPPLAPPVLPARVQDWVLKPARYRMPGQPCSYRS